MASQAVTAKMPILQNPEPHQRGATLVEALAAMAILAFGASLVIGGVRAVSPKLAVERAASDLEIALKAARHQARMSGAEARIDPVEGGYASSDGAVHFSGKVGASWRSDAGGAIVFRPSGFAAGAEIELVVGPHRRFVRVEPVTGRVHVAAD